MCTRRTSKRAAGRIAVGITAFLAAGPAQGGSGGAYELTWVTMDSGPAGPGVATGGAYDLRATVGQHDADVLFGGTYSLSGGFWFETPPGDCDSDGRVTRFDHGDLVDCFAGPVLVPGDTACNCFDFDQDADVDLVDFAEFARRYGSG